jgi:putative ABC transport system permease protein
VWLEIVGEVNDTRDRVVRESYDGPKYYTPLGFGGNQWELITRTSTDPIAIASAIERVVRAVDQGAEITNVKTLDQLLYESAAQPRFQTALLGSFSALALLLAVIGIYGVTSYSVLQRTHEIGVRMALGARAADVMRLVMGQGGTLALIGVALGLAGALALTRFLRNLLFEVQPTDVATFISVAILLFTAALAACYLPARRAMRVDPTVALRHE